MFRDFHIRIRTESPFYTPLRGDTLFGCLVWQIAQLHGDEAVRETLSRPFAVSSAFPAGFLPLLPALLETPPPAARRRLKRIRHIPLALFQELRADFHLERLLERLPARLPPEYFAYPTGVLAHNRIDRSSGQVAEGGLFFADVHHGPGEEFDLYASVADDDTGRFREALETLGMLGYGRDSSTGGGRFTVCDFAETTLFAGEHTHGIALSPFCPRKEDPADIRYELLPHFGRAWGRENFHKTPLWLMSAGSFLAYPKDGFVGSLLHGVQEDERAVHGARARVLGVSL